MRTLFLCALFYLLVSVRGGGGSKGASEEKGAERLRSEISADGGVEPLLESELRDALKDILAVLQHGSDASKEGALERLVELAVHTGEAGREQAVAFRVAIVAGGALPPVVKALSSESTRRQHLGATALHALALDDPSTQDDNDHQLEICKAGAVPPLVRMLSAAEPGVQHAATGALSALAENPACQAMIAAEGAVAPLLDMASYGSDMQKLGALGALEVLQVNNADVRTQLQANGLAETLNGIASMGSPLLRGEAATFGARLIDSSAPPPKLSPSAHVKVARETRARYDGVRHRAFRMMQGWGAAESPTH